jgi:hypothetical protein
MWNVDFRDSEFCAISDHFGANPAPFCRPNDFMQPCLERHVVCEAPEERHCSMCVGVDKAGNQDMPRPFDQHARLEALLCLCNRQYGLDAVIRDGHGVVLEDLARMRNRHAPARYDQGVTVLHGCRSIRVAPGSASSAFQPFLQS